MKTNLCPLLLCLLLAAALLLGSCTQRAPSAAEVLDGMCAAVSPLPAGRKYVQSAPKDSQEHFSTELLAATFGNGASPPAAEHILDAAVWFSYTDATELAVFSCKSADGADAVAGMCLDRLDILKNYRTAENADANGDSLYRTAQVRIHGRWVVLCIAHDPDAVLRAFRRAL